MLGIVQDFEHVWKFDAEEKGVLDLVSDVGGSQVVEESLDVIANFYFHFWLCFCLPLCKVFDEELGLEKLNKRHEFFLLIVPSRLSRIYKNGGTHEWAEYWIKRSFLNFFLDDNKEVEFDTLVIVRSWKKPNPTK